MVFTITCCLYSRNKQFTCQNRLMNCLLSAPYIRKATCKAFTRTHGVSQIVLGKVVFVKKRNTS